MEIFAKNGVNIDLLRETVLRQRFGAQSQSRQPAVAQSLNHLSIKVRIYCYLICQLAPLKVRDMLLSGSCFGHIKAMYNERKQKRQAIHAGLFRT